MVFGYAKREVQSIRQKGKAHLAEVVKMIDSARILLIAVIMQRRKTFFLLR